MSQKVTGTSVIGTRHEREGGVNQDVGLTKCWAGYTLAVVCDGVGGEPRGDEAADALAEFFKEEVKQAVASGISINDDVLFDCLSIANDLARKKCVGRGYDTSRPGSTIVAVVCHNDVAYWVSCGDSLIYYTDGAEVEVVNPLDEDSVSGALTACPVYDNTLPREGHHGALPFGRGKRLILASDGVEKGMSLEAVKTASMSGGEEVVAQAYDRDGSDDTTAIVVMAEVF